MEKESTINCYYVSIYNIISCFIKNYGNFIFFLILWEFFLILCEMAYTYQHAGFCLSNSNTKNMEEFFICNKRMNKVNRFLCV